MLDNTHLKINETNIFLNQWNSFGKIHTLNVVFYTTVNTSGDNGAISQEAIPF